MELSGSRSVLNRLLSSSRGATTASGATSGNTGDSPGEIFRGGKGTGCSDALQHFVGLSPLTAGPVVGASAGASGAAAAATPRSRA